MVSRLLNMKQIPVKQMIDGTYKPTSKNINPYATHECLGGSNILDFYISDPEKLHEIVKYDRIYINDKSMIEECLNYIHYMFGNDQMKIVKKELINDNILLSNFEIRNDIFSQNTLKRCISNGHLKSAQVLIDHVLERGMTQRQSWLLMIE